MTFGYADGAYSPGLFPDKTCLARMGSRTFPESSSHFPFSTICDGVEIVPAWINPTLIVLSTVAAVALLAFPLAYVIRRFPLTAQRTHDI
ncbi:hypothetical protein ACFVT2_07690 [Streptomyces sp. NPDC058000]|uniref:hypothetical protein n=1 Tax=Streptomyces sp. NPDC058000 TaxID=3346299 RepID=UPI0036EE125E